jgi:hypothetical protein
LRPRERELLEFVLPPDRPGYRPLLGFLETALVAGEGRRGEGNLVLAPPGVPVDLTVPPPPIMAYGMVETTHTSIVVSVSEPSEGQLIVELVAGGGTEVPEHFEEKRRWTLSSWQPGLLSPVSGGAVREVPVGSGVVVVLAASDRRLWMWEEEGRTVQPIPVTNFHNELMLHKRIRDPQIALRPGELFVRHGEYVDADLRAAFIRYNAARPRVHLSADPSVPPAQSMADRVRSLLRKGT